MRKKELRKIQRELNQERKRNQRRERFFRIQKERERKDLIASVRSIPMANHGFHALQQAKFQARLLNVLVKHSQNTAKFYEAGLW